MPHASRGTSHVPNRSLLSDEPTVELLKRARVGDTAAVEALLQRSLPALKRWAHGKLPASARGYLETSDLVQEAAMSAIAHLDTFESRHVGAMQAFLRQCVINRIRDEVRRVIRRPNMVQLDDDVQSDAESPLEAALLNETYERYHKALARLNRRDRELVIAHVELQWKIVEVAAYFGFHTTAGARMAVTRARGRLVVIMGQTAKHGSGRPTKRSADASRV